MKKLHIFLYLFIAASYSLAAQEKTVNEITARPIAAINTVSIKEEAQTSKAATFICTTTGVNIVKLAQSFDGPDIQRVFTNQVQAITPNFRIITDTNFNQIQGFSIRGQEVDVIIIDGVRYTDPSILNTINPQDIEKIKVYRNATAKNQPTISFK